MKSKFGPGKKYFESKDPTNEIYSKTPKLVAYAEENIKGYERPLSVISIYDRPITQFEYDEPSKHYIQTYEEINFTNYYTPFKKDK